MVEVQTWCDRFLVAEGGRVWPSFSPVLESPGHDGVGVVVGRGNLQRWALLWQGKCLPLRELFT